MNRIKSSRHILLLAALAVAGLLPAVPAPAQECLRVESTPERASLTVRGDIGISSTAPGNFCSLQAGRSYRLTVHSPAYELRTLKFTLGADGNPPSFGGIRAEKVAKSLVLPGWGQSSLGHTDAAAQTLLTVAVMGFRTWRSFSDYSDAKDRHDLLLAASGAALSEDAAAAEQRMISTAAREANAYRDDLVMAAAFTGWVYAANLLETLLLASPPKATAIDANTFSVEIPRRSKARAAFRSLVFPGLGQRYNGSESKAFLYHGLFVTMVMYALDAKLRYDIADSDYELALGRVDGATTVEEIEEARLEAVAFWNERDDRQQSLYRFAGIAGAVWLLNVVDAAFFGGNQPVANRVDFEASYGTSGIRSGLAVRF